MLPGQERKRRIWLFLAGAGAVAASILLIIRKRKAQPLAPPVPAHVTALNALDALPEEETQRAHQIARILTEYLGNRYRLPTEGKTSREIIPLVPDEHKADLSKFMEGGEQIRFSNRIPDGYTCNAEAFVRTFIETTTSEEEPCD
jgi:hypothetical protein